MRGRFTMRAVRTPGKESIPSDGHEINKQDAMRRRHKCEIENLGGRPQLVIGLHDVPPMSGPFAPGSVQIMTTENGVGHDKPSAENPRHDPLIQRHFLESLFYPRTNNEFV